MKPNLLLKESFSLVKTDLLDCGNKCYCFLKHSLYRFHRLKYSLYCSEGRKKFSEALLPWSDSKLNLNFGTWWKSIFAEEKPGTKLRKGRFKTLLIWVRYFQTKFRVSFAWILLYTGLFVSITMSFSQS